MLLYRICCSSGRAVQRQLLLKSCAFGISVSLLTASAINCYTIDLLSANNLTDVETRCIAPYFSDQVSHTCCWFQANYGLVCFQLLRGLLMSVVRCDLSFYSSPMRARTFKKPDLSCMTMLNVPTHAAFTQCFDPFESLFLWFFFCCSVYLVRYTAPCCPDLWGTCS